MGRATINIAHHSQVEEASYRFSKGAIRWISNFVISANHSYFCEPYKPRTDNYMKAVYNICQSYLTSSASDASCKSSMVSIMSVSYSVRNDNPPDSCEAYKLRIINFMNDIKDITSRW